VDAVTEQLARQLSGAPDPWAARDAYVDVVVGQVRPSAFATVQLGSSAGPLDVATFLALMEAQRWRLAMFASCGWFWESPERPETAAALRAAVRAARLVDGLAGTSLERRLVDDLGSVRSPEGERGAHILGVALARVGQLPVAVRR
jgi:hypothetical protein